MVLVLASSTADEKSDFWYSNFFSGTCKISKIIFLQVDIFNLAFKVFHRPVESENTSLSSRSLFYVLYTFFLWISWFHCLGLLFNIKVVPPILIHLFSHILSSLFFFLVYLLGDLLYFIFHTFYYILYFYIIFLIPPFA